MKKEEQNYPGDESVYWNPHNKVVQSHKDGTIYTPELQWIRTKDQLPETGQSCLIVNDIGSVYMASFDGKTFCYEFDNPATHWMHLPKPPQKGCILCDHGDSSVPHDCEKP